MISIKLLITYFLTQVYVICVASPTTKNISTSLYRLPTSIHPISYNITLFTNVTRGDFRYKGIVNINLSVTNEAKEIVLHSDKLSINQEQSVLEKFTASKPLETLKIQAQTYENETQFYKISFGNFIAPGEYRLTLHFDGEVVDDYFGFYRSSYIKDNQRRWLGVTQFSPTYARRAFPCMDEPRFKATFQINIGHYSNEIVSSNMLAESRQLIHADKKLGDYYITHFAKTPRMSTYLLVWAVHDFARLNSTKPYMWLWTRSPTLKSNNSPVLLDGPLLETTLENYTGMPTPLRKFEQMVVPDFKFDGMENWGMIAYSEAAGLIDYTSSPAQTIFNEVMVVSHEYSHSYFGNLVTASYWDCIWLNEGFADYFQFLNLDSVHKDWRIMEIFSVSELQSALLSDSYSESARPMNDPDKFGNQSSTLGSYDFISYAKGSSVLRMFADVLGKEPFRRAVQSYLERWKYEAVTPNDLYRELDAVATGLPTTFGEMFDSWTNQTNYPLVQTSRIGNKVTLTQRSFDFSGKATAKRWWIPIIVLAPNFESKLQWLPNNNKSISVELPKNSPWFVVNPRLTGYYRVDYNMENWQALISFLKTGSLANLPSVSRAALIDDVFNVWKAGLRNVSLPMSLAEYLTRERDYVPWYTASQMISILDQAYQNVPKTLTTFRQFAIKLITPIYEELTIKEEPSDSFVKKMHRESILNVACLVGYKPCVSAAKNTFDGWIANKTKKIPNHFKSFVYRTVIIHGTDQDWENLWKRFLQTDSFNLDKPIMIEALLDTNNTSFLKRLLDFANQSNSDLSKGSRERIRQVVGSIKSSNVHTSSLDAQKISTNVVRSPAVATRQRALKMTHDDLNWINRSATEVLQYINNI